MNDEPTHNQILDKLPAYVIGALEPDEMLAIDSYISKQQDLLTRLQDSEEAAAQIAHLAPTVPLPPDAKANLLDRVQIDLGRQSVVVPEAPAQPASPTVTSPSDDAKSEAAGFGGWLNDALASLKPLNGWTAAAGVAVVLLLLSVVYTGQIQNRLGQAETQRETLQVENARIRASNGELQQVNQRLQDQLQAEQDRLTFVADIGPDRVVQLPGTEEAPEASGLLYLGDDDQALIALNGLAPLSSQQTYQLWLIPANAAPVPAGLLAVTDEAITWLKVQLPEQASGFEAVGISIEPTGGSLSPTGPIVLLGSTAG